MASQTYEDQQSYAKDAESLKTQIVQTSLAFLKWSDLWKKYVPKSNWNFSSRNQQRVFEIEAELQDINNKISIDPTGTKEAENHRDVLDLINTQISKNENIAQGMKDNITKKGQLAEKQNSLKNELNYLDGLIAEVQKKIKKQEDEIEADKAKLAELKTDREIRLETLGKLQNELTSQLNDLKTSNNLKVDEPTDDESLRTCSGGETTQQEKVDQCNTTLKQLDAIETQQKNAVNESADEQLLRQKIDNGEKQLVVEPNNSIDPFVAAVNSYIDSSDKTETLSIESLIGVMQGQSITLATQLDSLSLAREFIQGKIEYLQSGIEQISIDISIIQNNNDSDGKTELNKKIEAVGIQISSERNQQIKKLEAERYDKQVEILKENSGSDQLEGQFVLDILENNILPLLYGILGALTFALRTLARQIKSVTYSGAVGAQHVSHIALGALAGILVGWFSNLLTNDSFLSSVSPFAIAFLVGYNIELVFLKMDEYVVTRISKTQEKTLPAIGNTGIASTTQINHPEQESTPVEAPDKENPVE